MFALIASRIMARTKQNGAPAPEPFVWDSWDMGKPLVDLEDKEAVQRILDEEDGWYDRRP